MNGNRVFGCRCPLIELSPFNSYEISRRSMTTLFIILRNLYKVLNVYRIPNNAKKISLLENYFSLQNDKLNMS